MPDRAALREQYERSGIMFDVRPIDLLDGWDAAEARAEATELNLEGVLREKENLRLLNNTLLADKQRLQFHLEEMISVTAGGPTNTDISEGARIWRVRQEALGSLKGMSWQHDFYYAALDKAALARSILQRVKAGREASITEELWADINAFLEL